MIVGPVFLSEAHNVPHAHQLPRRCFTPPRTAPAYGCGWVATTSAIWSCAVCLDIPRMVPRGNWRERPKEAGYCLEVWLSPRRRSVRRESPAPAARRR